MKENVVPLLDRYIPWFRRILLYQGMPWEPTWKTVPTMSQANEKLKSGALNLGPSLMDLISPVSHAWCLRCQLTRSSYSLFTRTVNSGPLAYCGHLGFASAGDKNKKMFSGSDLDYYEKDIGPSLPHPVKVDSD